MTIKPEKLGWKISNFEKTIAKQNDNQAIRAGDDCRLFHREQEGFICLRYNDTDLRVNSDAQNLATDALFDDFLPNTEEEEQYFMHLKLSSVVRRSKVSNSSTTIFKIEKKRQNDGGPIEWHSPVRFKHLSSNLYLKLQQTEDENQPWTLALSRSYKDENALFLLVPMASDTIKNYATFNSLAQIKHVKSGLYISIANYISLD